jgi:hypothetical protein
MPSPQGLSFVARALAVVTLLSAGGCTIGTDFWRQCACVSSAYAGARDLSGCWDGCWTSHTTGHNGQLQAVITPCRGNTFHVRFHGTFFKLLSFEYEIDMTGTPTESGYAISGQKDLGKLAGGMFYYSGYVRGDDFVVTYRTCKDHGVFVMKRLHSGRCTSSCSCCK